MQSIGLVSWLSLALLCCCLLASTAAVRAPESLKGLSPDGPWTAPQAFQQANVVPGAAHHARQALQEPWRLAVPQEATTSAAAAAGEGGGALTRAHPQQQHQQQHHSLEHPSSHHQQQQQPGALPASSRHLTQAGQQQQQPYPPADLIGLDSILAAAREAFALFDPANSLAFTPAYAARRQRQPRGQQQQQQQNHPSSSRALGAVGGRGSRGSSSSAGGVDLVVTFVQDAASVDSGVDLRLPPPPRAFNLTVRSADGAVTACTAERLAYAEQAVPCPGLLAAAASSVTEWVATLVDADADNLRLAEHTFSGPPPAAGATVQLPVVLGLLSLEASFGELAWAGLYYPRPQRSTSTIVIHAQIVGAQVAVFTQQGGSPTPWDTQWTGDDGMAHFWLAPGVRDVFIANMSVGETVLKSAPLLLDTPTSSSSRDSGLSPGGSLAPQPAVLQLVATPQLLCTGEVEDVRGEAGTFPPALDPAKQSVYHPKGFVCRWELIPEQPDVLLSVDYRGLLPDEAVTLVLGPNNIVQLTRPADSPGAVYQASLWVERSILVAFQSTRSSTNQTGSFSISWTSVSSTGRGVLDSKTMVIVLACVSAAGALLAACCFYFVCCGRRRRAGGAVVAAGVTAEVSLPRVPSAVRELLPSKPYEAPEAPNPLPGAANEPDCCSVCLAEFEPGEPVTVLPCLHFYHRECIGSWLQRNCTCPLCKANVLDAFKLQQHEARHAERRRRRNLLLFGVTSPTPDHYSGSSSSLAAAAGSEHPQQQQVELTAVLPHTWPPPPQHHSPQPTVAGGFSSRAASPWAPLDGTPPPPSPGGAAAATLDPQAQQAVQLQRGGGARGAHSDDASLASSGSLSVDLGVVQVITPAAGAPAAASPTPLAIPLSPAPAALLLPAGEQQVRAPPPLDFAPAAAAAAAALAQHQAEAQQAAVLRRQRSATSPLPSPSALAEAAVSAAQASIAALRSASIRTLGRWQPAHDLQPSLRGGGVGDQASAASPSGVQGAAGNGVLPEQQRPGSSSSGGAARLAVSIYAFADDHHLATTPPAAAAAARSPDSLARISSLHTITVDSPGSSSLPGEAAQRSQQQQQQQE